MTELRAHNQKTWLRCQHPLCKRLFPKADSRGTRLYCDTCKQKLRLHKEQKHLKELNEATRIIKTLYNSNFLEQQSNFLNKNLNEKAGGKPLLESLSMSTLHPKKSVSLNSHVLGEF